MRLRYAHIQNLPPLDDVEIVFGHERALGRDCAIHFLVGVNGSGKSRLLLALAEILLGLEALRVPTFPVNLVYDVESGGARYTVVLFHPGGPPSAAELKVFKATDTEGPAGELPKLHQRSDAVFRCAGNELGSGGSTTIDEYLPRVLLVYSSGFDQPWEKLFRSVAARDDDLLSGETRPVDFQVERPPGFRGRPDTERAAIESNAPNALPDDEHVGTRRGLFVSPSALRLSICTVAVAQWASEARELLSTEGAEEAFLRRVKQSRESGQRMAGLRGLLNEVDWLWPVTISLRVDVRSGKLFPRRRRQIAELARIATAVTREAEADGAIRTLFFDLRAPAPGGGPAPDTASAWLRVLGGESAAPLQVFRELLAWQQDRVLSEVGMIFRKRNVDDLLLFDWLSDGERMFLGRMALFHLLKGYDDALLLLDEPETHFNDVWKREIVDIIDESIGEQASEVLITTHSSIALTDAFSEEMTVFVKNPETGRVFAEPAPVNSFGALPGEILRNVFGSQGTVGKRAADLLELVLFLAGRAGAVEGVWAAHDLFGALTPGQPFDSPEFEQLFNEAAQHRSLMLLAPDQQRKRLSAVLTWLQQLARAFDPQKGPAQMTDALMALEERIGAGHYQFEIRRRLHALLTPEPAPPWQQKKRDDDNQAPPAALSAGA